MSRTERLAMWASTAAIAAAAVAQAPGRILPETKLDVVVDPLGFLGRALDAWDPAAGFGRTQNQAAGYLFPMGAFSAVGDALAIPDWLVQRAWIALVVALALWGAHRVAGAVGVASAGGRLAAAWAYALAPALLSVVAFQSAGQLPYALAPHVLVPLLTMGDGDDPRRVAARSALWVAAMGGVNGASVFAVLPLVAIWFLTRAPGPARRRLAAWWAAGVVAATLWWLIPLGVTIRYGVRFTDFTETAALTTATESATEILRGTDNWVTYLVSGSGLWLPGAWELTADRLAIVGSLLVAGAGLWGLARRGAPGREWLVPSAVLGAVAMGAGYAGAGGGPFDEPVRAALDGALGPFRNVHKFAAVVRLPVAIGLGHAVVVASAAVRARAAGQRVPRLAPLGALALVVAGVAPAVGGTLTAPGSFEDVPDSWRGAAAWLSDADDGSRALVIPGAAFGEYTWGRPLDEPLSALGVSSWAVRDLIPLGGNGSTRVLDGLDAALAQGDLPPGFTQALQRGGVGYLVVRNDLDRDRTGGPSPATVRRLLSQDPSLTLAASFGEVVAEPGDDGRLGPRPGAAAADVYREIDIYAVPDPAARAEAYPLERAAVVEGGPEAVVNMDPDVLAGRASVLAVDPGAALVEDPLVVATDSARRRDVRFGSIRDNASYTLTAHAASPLDGTDPVDRWPADEDRGLTVAEVDGAASLTESSAPGRPARPESQPLAAFDGDPATSWSPWPDAVGAWLQVELDQPRAIGPVSVTVPDDARGIAAVTVETDDRSQTVPIGADGRAVATDVAGPTGRVRVRVAELDDAQGRTRSAISAVDIGGVEVSRPLAVASEAETGAEVVSLSRDRRDPFDPDRASEDAIVDRRFTWAGASEATVHGTAQPRPGVALDALLDDGPGAAGAVQPTIDVSASSQWRHLPAHRPEAAADGDPTTAWVSEPTDPEPRLELSWDGQALVDGVRIAGPEPFAEVVVDVDGQRSTATVDGTGTVAIAPTTTDRLALEFPGSATGAGDRVVVSEVEVSGLFGRTAAAWARDRPVELPCGDGPNLTVDGVDVATRASTTVGALVDGTAVAWEACEPVPMAQATHRLRADGSTALQVDTVTVLAAEGLEPPPAARATTVAAWDNDRRTIEVEAGDAAIVATTENYNDGWQARADGQELTPIRVDGWRQGWVLPAGEATTVTARYSPAVAQRTGLAIGLVALVGLVAAAAVRPRAGRRDRLVDPPTARPVPAWAALGLVGLAGLALGGALVVLAVPVVAVARRTRAIGTVVAVGVGVAAVAAVAGAGAVAGSSEGPFSWVAQAGAATALMAVAAALLSPAAQD